MAEDRQPETLLPGADAADSSAAQPSAPAFKNSAQGIGVSGGHGTAPIRAADLSASENSGEKQDRLDGEGQAAPQAPPLLPCKPGMAENAFRAMSCLAPLFLALLLAMQTAVGVCFPSLFLPEETAVIETYVRMPADDLWLVPPIGPASSPAMPGFFWLMAAVDAIPHLPQGVLLPLTAGFAALLVLLGTYVLGLSAGLGNRTAFAAGLMLLSSAGFVPLARWVGPDMLLTGLTALSLACLIRGWTRKRAFLWLGAGGLLAGLGALAGGLPALWIPLVGSLALLIWRGDLRRGHRMDAVAGFAILLLCVFGWLGAAILLTDQNVALASLRERFLPPISSTPEELWRQAAVPVLALLPWAPLPFFVGWGRVLGNAWAALKASRTENSGTAWLWISLTAGLLPVLLTPRPSPPAAALLLPMAALLLAKALMNLSPARSRNFFLLPAGLSLLAGAGLALMGIPAAAQAALAHLPAPLSHAAVAAEGLPMLGALFLLSGLALLKIINRTWPGGALAATALLVATLAQPAALITGPSLKDIVGVEHPRGMGFAAKTEKRPLPASPLQTSQERQEAPTLPAEAPRTETITPGMPPKIPKPEAAAP